MKDPIAVPNPKVRAPPDQHWIQFLDDNIEASVAGDRPYNFTHPLSNVLARFGPRPHVQSSSNRLPKLESQEREPVAYRCHTAFLLVHFQV
jgi:hypothetical protein